ncbi:aldo/keto reductase [Algoriphagus halophilus]|uniref:Alcohol dehydrogenase (NADP+) n=1 Tax=Algoriphagus halophilus TaxID=226505 RepID=A0A1N6DPF1_9BACT|nr:aldo/keto reductase [Algoriphagus halophilus]SIN72543.1 alcohol dehydrogenase (NADP+) [Algoriphagus halophilus]
MKNLTFENGDRMPIIGLGTWKSEPGQVKQAVYWAIESGYRHLDCAAVYQNEKEVGEGIAQAINEGLVEREELFVTSKLWNNSHKYEDVKPALEKTLSDLGLDYVDLYLIHWPISFKRGIGFAKTRDEFYTYLDVPLTQTWEGMQHLKSLGLAKHIGVSNFNQAKLREVMNIGGQKPEMNQVEMHPYLPQKALVQFCRENGILMTAYSPLGSPDSRNESHKNDPVLLKDPVIELIAKKHGASIGQVLIAWSVARDIAVIPKSTNQGRIKENLAAAKLKLDQNDLMELDDIGVDFRFINGKFFTGPESPYKLSDLFG